MNFENHDLVRVILGDLEGQVGEVQGYSLIHRNGKPEEHEYNVYFKNSYHREYILESYLELVERPDPQKREEEYRAKVKAQMIAEQKAKLKEQARIKLEAEAEALAEFEAEQKEKVNKS